MIALYIDLRLYDKACTDDETFETKMEIAEEIYEQYLSDEALAMIRDSNAGLEDSVLDKSYFPVVLDQQVKIMFDEKYEQIGENLNEYLFIEVYAFVLDKLREYFTFFKSSQAFV